MKGGKNIKSTAFQYRFSNYLRREGHLPTFYM